MRIWLGVLAIWLTTTFAGQVAAKCSGEAAFAVQECACTVKNRLEAGWSARGVLVHYINHLHISCSLL